MTSPVGASMKDFFGSRRAWTPAIGALYDELLELMSIDARGLYVWSPTSYGKSYAIQCILEALPVDMGPIASVCVTVPSWSDDVANPSRDEKKALSKESVLTSFLSQLGSQQRSRRYADLEGDLITHLLDLAETQMARRLVLVFDHAHNLEPSHQEGVVTLLSLLENKLRPFALLVGQAHAGHVMGDLGSVRRAQVLRRLFLHTHRFSALAPSDFEVVLNTMDLGLKESSSALATYLPEAYAQGFRLAKLADPLQKAYASLCADGNHSPEMGLPMQFFMSAVQWVLQALVRGAVEWHAVNANTLTLALRRSRYDAFMSVQADLDRYGVQ